MDSIWEERLNLRHLSQRDEVEFCTVKSPENDRGRAISEVLHTLKPQEEAVLRLRFGIST